VQIEDFFRRSMSRRSALKAGAAAALASQGVLLEQLAFTPVRPSFAAPAFSDIQFDIGAFVRPAQVFNDGAGDVTAQFGVTFALLTPARLTRNPTRSDQSTLANALATIEAVFPASPSGLLVVSVSYGVPYFRRLPAALVASRVPRLLSNTSRFVLEEAVPSPTDVVSGNGITKERFDVPVVIEGNDLLFEFKSDSVGNLVNVLDWLEGSNNLGGFFVSSPDFDGLLSFQTPRLQFTQPGLPRRVLDSAAQSNPAAYEYRARVNPDSSMFFGFVDQQTNASAAANVVTFVGSSKGVFTTARPGDYFDNGSIAHFSHDLEDLFQFYETPAQDPTGGGGEPFTERVQYAFRSNQLGTPDGLPADGNTDQFTNGGGPAFINNVFQGTDSALRSARDAAGAFGPGNATKDATFEGQHRLGHIDELQRSSRSAVDGTPLHIRNDGPGFSGLDVPAFQDFPGSANAISFPAGTVQPKLEFLVFVPTSEFFRVMRVNQASLDLQQQFGVDPDDNGFERFITASRRQNFLVPPRRHRSFPLIELT
jgi:hypothetical protein